MTRRAWKALGWISMLLWVPAVLLDLPAFLLRMLSRGGRWLLLPAHYCRLRAQGWGQVGPVWRKGHGRPNRRRDGGHFDPWGAVLWLLVVAVVVCVARAHWGVRP